MMCQNEKYSHQPEKSMTLFTKKKILPLPHSSQNMEIIQHEVEYFGRNEENESC